MVLELAIVVLGVVIGFQVTSWGQARSDVAKEQTYLRQLAADLHETLRLAERADSINTSNRSDRAAADAIRMYYLPEPPPRDSVIEWLIRPSWIQTVTPLLGTADALISSGSTSASSATTRSGQASRPTSRGAASLSMTRRSTTPSGAGRTTP